MYYSDHRPPRLRRDKVSGLTHTCLLVTLLAGSLSLPTGAKAQAVEPGEAVTDARLYFTAPFRWDGSDWLNASVVLAAVAATRSVDDSVRDHFTDDREPVDTSDDNEARDFIPAAVLIGGTWLYAGFLNSNPGYRELGSMIEAGVLTGASTALLRWGLGRERPNETDDPDNWFSGGDSMPSLHASTTFAVGTVFAESGGDEYRWIRRMLGYGAGAAVAWLRVDDNQHWASDVVAGAALGYFSARFVMHRRDGGERRSSFLVTPQDGGLVLSYSHALH